MLLLYVEVCLSCNGSRHINEVALRWAWLVLEWVTMSALGAGN